LELHGANRVAKLLEMQQLRTERIRAEDELLSLLERDKSGGAMATKAQRKLAHADPFVQAAWDVALAAIDEGPGAAVATTVRDAARDARIAVRASEEILEESDLVDMLSSSINFVYSILKELNAGGEQMECPSLRMARAAAGELADPPEE
jgi:hypothetical protein